MPNKITTKEEIGLLWQHMPDSLLLHIFAFLQPRHLLNSAQVINFLKLHDNMC